MAAIRPDSLALTPTALWEQLQPHWLVGPDADGQQAVWEKRVCDRRHQLEQFAQQTPISDRPLVLLADADPLEFLAGFWAALLTGWQVALANPQWGAHEWTSTRQLIRPQMIWGKAAALSTGSGIWENSDGDHPNSTEPAILIPTGGSGGQIKFARHRWSSLMASADGFCRYFRPDGDPVNVYCVLPVYHVSGLMQMLRAWVSGGQVAIAPFKQLEASQPQVHHPQDWFISLVPTQLERLMQSGKSAWLSKFQAVLLGGAPAWTGLLDRAAAQQIPLCLSYGMTETAAMVTALRPQAFLQGDRSCGPALPHATVQIMQTGQPLPPGEIGQITVSSGALATPSSGGMAPETFTTDDLGYLSPDGHLHITGRVSGKIISGGENVFPAEVESVLRGTGQVKDVCVVGLPHLQWGEAVTAAYVPIDSEVSEGSLRQAIARQLSPYKQPKQWIPLKALPRNLQGKVNRQALLAQIAPLSSQADRPLAGDGGDCPY